MLPFSWRSRATRDGSRTPTTATSTWPTRRPGRTRRQSATLWRPPWPRSSTSEARISCSVPAVASSSGSVWMTLRPRATGSGRFTRDRRLSYTVWLGQELKNSKFIFSNILQNFSLFSENSGKLPINFTNLFFFIDDNFSKTFFNFSLFSKI